MRYDTVGNQAPMMFNIGDNIGLIDPIKMIVGFGVIVEFSVQWYTIIMFLEAGSPSNKLWQVKVDIDNPYLRLVRDNTVYLYNNRLIPQIEVPIITNNTTFESTLHNVKATNQILDHVTIHNPHYRALTN
jgi:hypothetical protein